MTPTPTDLKNAKEFITQLARSENDPLDQDEVNAQAQQTTHLGRPAYISGIRLEHSPKWPYTVTAFEIICCEGVFLERLQEQTAD